MPRRVHVATVIDLFSRRVIGWSISATVAAQWVADALMMAIWRRCNRDALVHQSDQGSQCCWRIMASPTG
jgi:putative transposase